MRHDTYVEVDPRLFGQMGCLDVIEAVDLGFEPRLASVLLDDDQTENGVDLRFKGAKTVERLRGFRASNINVESADGMTTYLAWSHYGHLRLIGVEDPSGFIDVMCERDGFLGAASGDGADRMWQSETEISEYALEGRAIEGLPRVWDPVWEREIIDISGNPGRDSGTAGIGLWPAADLWYGPGCGEFMDFAAVRTVPVGEVTELANGVLHVHLFDVDTPEPEVRRRQQVLRDHLRFDELAARADEINLALRKRGEPVQG